MTPVTATRKTRKRMINTLQTRDAAGRHSTGYGTTTSPLWGIQRAGRVACRWLAHRLDAMLEAGSRKRNQPAPPHVMFEALTQPDRDPARPWLELLDDEQRPRVVEASKPGLVVWSSLWIKRPDAIVRFDLPPDRSGYGTDLRWTLLVDEPMPDAPLVGHMRKRLNQLINANLR